MSLEGWIKAVDLQMRRDWCIDSIDAGLSPEELKRFWGHGETPAEFVAWFAKKHDLLRFEQHPFRVRPR
ncbi:hypothetical protein Q0812_00825 [Brevundimonas sp. 2R-24]|uniref:Uncharacterized protein n=1 Tax=Peiella sedimenti TaxID=3061083 RepID=A0ABT8SHF5_9CAUL|nr:hypothetical protein [Caulobacteraceae bacterium XZ-24]